MKKGNFGMGALFVMIGLVLSTFMVAMIVINITRSGTQPVIDVSEEADENTQFLQILDITGYAPDYESVAGWYIRVRMSPNSDPVNLSETMIQFSGLNGTEEFNYNMSHRCGVDTNGFGVRYKFMGNRFLNATLHKEDVAELCFKTTQAAYPLDWVEFRIISTEANPTDLRIKMPGIFDYQMMQLYP